MRRHSAAKPVAPPLPAAPAQDRRWRVAAFAWGVAEATVFFIVPDVLLTVAAQRRGMREALRCTAFAVGGALLGGIGMWAFGRHDPDAARALVEAVPAISADMVARAESELARAPVAALFKGAFSGVPYKVFAALAPGAGLSLPALLALTAASRAARFLAVAAIAFLLDRLLARWLDFRTRALILAGAWIVFYTAYWSLTPW